MTYLTTIQAKRQMLAQISVCQGCCCGHTEKGHPEVPVEWLKKEWKLRGLNKRVQLTISGCLGPCDLPNVVLIGSFGGTQWLAKITTRQQYTLLADWAEQSKDADCLLPLPRQLHANEVQIFRDQQPALHFEGQS